MIHPRAEWGARPPKSRNKMSLPSPRLWLHHTAGNEPDGAEGMRRIQNFHMDTRGWSDIGYSFVVDRNGDIFEGRGAGVVGAHTEGDNSKSHAICVIGNYEVSEPTSASLRAVSWLVAHGRAQGWWTELTGGHRNAPGAATSCPGRSLYARIGEIRQGADGVELSADEKTRLLADLRVVRVVAEHQDPKLDALKNLAEAQLAILTEIRDLLKGRDG